MDKKEKGKPIAKYQFPNEWKSLKLESISRQIYYGITAKARNNDTGLKMLRTTDIDNYKVDWTTLPFCEIREKSNNLNKYFLRKNDLIVARAGTIGVSVLIDHDFDNTVFGSYLIKVKLEERVNPKFVHYFFQSNVYWEHLHGAQGSTMKNINLPLLKSLTIPLPPLSEQKKIVEVLSNVDSAIEEVDKSMVKNRKLKKGLMEELLTKGIGHKEFKETEINEIPKEWKVVEMKDATDINKEFSDPIRELPNNKFFYIDIDSVENGTGIIKNLREIIGREAPSRARRQVRYNDVIMSTVRPYLKAFAIIPKLYDGQICSTGFAVLRCKEKILPKFLLYILFSRSLVSQFNKAMVGAQYPALNSSQVNKLKLPLPPLPEQNKIAEILSTVDERIQLLKEKRGKLERVKKGLMYELLTGRKRVKVEA